MPKFGDILPNASGRSNIGVDGGTTAGSFDAASVSPFGHIIGLSGVYMDPLLGQSGIIRYSRAASAFQVSVDGGATFTNLDLTDHTLQNAYNGGRVVQLQGIPVGPIGILDGNETVELRESPGHIGSDTFLNQLAPLGETSALAVSGSTWLPDDRYTFSYSSLTSYRLGIQGSGTPSLPPAQIVMRTNTDQATLAITARRFDFNMGSGAFVSALGDVQIKARSSNGFQGIGGQLKLHAFDPIGNAPSGQLEYRFGPHEAWYWSPSYDTTGGPFGDGFHPLVASGQIVQMIGGLTSLDSAHDVGNEIDLHVTKSGGDAGVGRIYQGVIVKEPGTKDDAGGTDLREIFTDQGFATERPAAFGYAVSGHTIINDLTEVQTGSNYHDSYPIAQLGPNMLYIQGSGAITNEGASPPKTNDWVVTEPPKLWIGVSGVNPAETNNTASIRTNQQLDIFAINAAKLHTHQALTLQARTNLNLISNNVTVDAGGIVDIDGSSLDADFATTANITALTTLTLTGVTSATLSSAGDVLVTSTAADVDVTAENQVTLSAFQASGMLDYRFGPNEAWHTSPSHTSDFFPIPFSGQVEEMIRKSINPFASGLHTLGGTDARFDFDPSLPADLNPYAFVSQNSGLWFNPVTGNGTQVLLDSILLIAAWKSAMTYTVLEKVGIHLDKALREPGVFSVFINWITPLMVLHS